MHKNITGMKILFLLRNQVEDWAGLCIEFGFESDVLFSTHIELLHHLRLLREAGFIEFDEDQIREGNLRCKIRLSSNWWEIQTALGISLTSLSKFHPSESMIVRPFFGLPNEKSTQTDIFVLMPFAAILKNIYDDHIKNVARNLSLNVARADDFFTAHSVMSDVWSAIHNARLIIADCTGRNPNVFYEIGLAHVLGKHVILITQNNDDVPFDLRHIRFIEYQYTPRGMGEFEKKLTETIKAYLY